eukprot:403345387
MQHLLKQHEQQCQSENRGSIAHITSIRKSEIDNKRNSSSNIQSSLIKTIKTDLTPKQQIKQNKITLSKKGQVICKQCGALDSFASTENQQKCCQECGLLDENTQTEFKHDNDFMIAQDVSQQPFNRNGFKNYAVNSLKAQGGNMISNLYSSNTNASTNSRGGAVSRQMIRVRYSKEETSEYIKNQKLQSLIDKLAFLSEQDRQKVFDSCSLYIDEMRSVKSKTENYNIVVASCAYLLKKQGKISDCFEVKDLIRIFSDQGCKMQLKPKNLIKTSENIKLAIQDRIYPQNQIKSEINCQESSFIHQELGNSNMQRKNNFPLVKLNKMVNQFIQYFKNKHESFYFFLSQNDSNPSINMQLELSDVKEYLERFYPISLNQTILAMQQVRSNNSNVLDELNSLPSFQIQNLQDPNILSIAFEPIQESTINLISNEQKLQYEEKLRTLDKNLLRIKSYLLTHIPELAQDLNLCTSQLSQNKLYGLLTYCLLDQIFKEKDHLIRVNKELINITQTDIADIFDLKINTLNCNYNKIKNLIAIRNKEVMLE